MAKNNRSLAHAQKLALVLDGLKTQEEKAHALKALFTATELSSLNKRLQILQLIETGLPYTTISKKLRVSSATIATLNQQVADATREVILEKLARAEHIRQTTNKIWSKLPSWLKG